MEIKIKSAEMNVLEDGDYLGKVAFTVDHHKEPYEIVFHKKRGQDWGYSLHFLHNSGPEEEIDAVDQFLTDNDDAFDSLLHAAQQAAEQAKPDEEK